MVFSSSSQIKTNGVKQGQSTDALHTAPNVLTTRCNDSQWILTHPPTESTPRRLLTFDEVSQP